MLHFETQVAAKQARAMLLVVFALSELLALGKIGQLGIRPNLAVRMRIAGAHNLTPVFENLHMANPGNGTEFAVLFRPDLNHAADFLHFHSRDGQVMAWRETNYATDSSLRATDDQAVLIQFVVS